MTEPPLSLYVHLPWCVRKCPYCDFNSHTANDATPRDRYIDALLADIEGESERAGDRQLISVFLGGGTPSFFSPQQIERIINGIKDEFALSPDVEITMEANPGTVECGDPAGYRAAGVNRLSVGAQSFSAEALHALGRIHSTDDIYRAVDSARDAGFDNINIDVMFGLPGQDIDAAMADIEAALSLRPQHFSWYQLTLEPNTVFHARPPAGLPSNDLAADIQRSGQALLAEHGYSSYEVSAYAKADLQCRHNLNYWTFGDYLAVGAGAHGKLTQPDGVRRYSKPANPEGYMRAVESGAALPAVDVLAEGELLFEFMLNALRLTDGFGEKLFTERTSLAAERLAAAAGPSVDRGLLERDAGGHWRATDLGRRFLNDLQAAFLP